MHECLLSKMLNICFRWIGGKKSVNPSKEVIKKAVYFLLNDETVTDEAWVQLRGLHRQELSGRDDDEGGMDGDEEEEVAGKEKEGVMRFSMGGKDDSFRSFYRLETSTADSMGVKSEGISKEPEEEDEEDEDEERLGKGKGKWDWMNDILKILKTLSGLRKLSDEKLPSTAPIGNQGILEGCRLLSEACGFGASGITASLFMGIKRGVKSTLTIAISLSDNKKTISLQWDCLRSAFADPSSVLLFHLKNHYALIFAIREYTSSSSSSSSPSSSSPSDESSPITIREVLTARRGQRPTVWISYEEMREICFSWEGYKVIRLSRSPSSSS